MRFYYISLFSVILLSVLYFVGSAVLVGFGIWLRKRWNKAWMVMVPLFLLLYIGPIAEELWIAWNFGHLCKKDAGIFIHKVVEVEGFYDATRSTHDGPRTPQAIEEYERSGYKFYEKKFRDTGKFVHVEKINGVWTPTVLDHTTARYHYRWPHMDTLMAHKVNKIERVVTDSESTEVLARETKYRREAPWFFIGLDRPVMLCPDSGEHPLSKHGSVFNLALKPKRSD